MTPWRRAGRRAGATLLALTTVLAAVLVTACGVESPPTYSGTAPEVWAGSVCGALAPWRTRIADLNAQAQAQLAASTTPEQTRDNLLVLLSGAEQATEQTRELLVNAGVPAVALGPEIAARFAASLAGAREAYAHAATAVKALSVADQKAFYDGLVIIFQRLNEEYSRTGVDTSGLEAPQLRAAFAEVEQCR